MKRSPEHVAAHRARTRETAAALLEDIAHRRDVLSGGPPSRGELRRLSGTLRRVLVDDRDLQNVASPRIGRIWVLAPANKPFIKYCGRYPPLFFASGGADVFGMTLGPLMLHGTRLDDAAVKRMPSSNEGFARVEMKLDNLLAQRVLYFDNTWISRRHVIKHIANYAHGIHSKTPDEDVYKILSRVRKAVTYNQTTGIRFDTRRLGAADPPLKYDADALDVVLLEVLVTAAVIVDAPDVARLEAIIREELSNGA